MDNARRAYSMAMSAAVGIHPFVAMAVGVESAGNVQAMVIAWIQTRAFVPRERAVHASVSPTLGAMGIHPLAWRVPTAISVGIVMAIGIVRMQTSPCVL
jgi:hypothetical protein